MASYRPEVEALRTSIVIPQLNFFATAVGAAAAWSGNLSELHPAICLTVLAFINGLGYLRMRDAIKDGREIDEREALKREAAETEERN